MQDQLSTQIVGVWELDPRRRELRVAGVPVSIGARALEVVAVLAEAAGGLTTKDEIMSRVWPGTIIEENRLQVHISTIRKALGPYRAMLQTVSGRGYRLLGGATKSRDRAPRPIARQAESSASAAP